MSFISQFRQSSMRWNHSKSSTLGGRLSTNPEEWEQYHTLYRKARESWTVVPFLLVVIWKRSELWYNPNGRRATIAILGSVVCLFLHRWVATRYDVPPAPVIFTDTFIISLGFANATPAIPSGLHISIFCLLIGCITVFFPGTFWWSSVLMILFIASSISLDILRERRKK